MQFSIQTIGLTILATISVLPGMANAQGSSGREDLCATYECHEACGLMIIEGQKCSENMTDTFSGPYTPGCVCNEDAPTPFQEHYSECLECGWTLWKYYSPYLSEALVQCAKDFPRLAATEPTGTLRCTTTLSETYTRDPDINYSTFLSSTTTDAI